MSRQTAGRDTLGHAGTPDNQILHGQIDRYSLASVAYYATLPIYTLAVICRPFVYTLKCKQSV